MIFFSRLVRSTLDWVHPQKGEDWGHRLTWTVTTIVAFPVVMSLCAVLLLGSTASPDIDPEVYGVKRLFGALWVLIWVFLFFPVDRIATRHVSGEEPTESKWLIFKFTTSALFVFVLASWAAATFSDS